jgi:hypothetical protein
MITRGLAARTHARERRVCDMNVRLVQFSFFRACNRADVIRSGQEARFMSDSLLDLEERRSDGWLKSPRWVISVDGVTRLFEPKVRRRGPRQSRASGYRSRKAKVRLGLVLFETRGQAARNTFPTE